VPSGSSSTADDGDETEVRLNEETSTSKSDGLWEEDPSFNQVMKLCTHGHLLSRPWFTRTWIIPEVMTARSLWIMLSNGELLPWYPMYTAALTAVQQAGSDTHAVPYVVRLQREYDLDHRLTRRDHDLPGLPRKPINFGHWKLWEMLESTRESQCEDPRDKLYALLPLLVQPVPRLLRPDYTKSIAQVYADVAWFMIDYGVQDVLSAAGGVAFGGTDVPSWAVDWRTARPMRVEDLVSVTDEANTWRAGFEEGERVLKAQRRDDVLLLRGLMIGEVGETKEEGETMLVEESLSPEDREPPMSDDTGPPTGYRNFRPNDPADGSKDVDKLPADAVEAAEFEIRGNSTRGKTHVSVRPGDHVCVILGTTKPFVLRPFEDGWKLVGECVVPDFMHGKAVAGVDWSKVDDEEPMAPLQDFRIY